MKEPGLLQDVYGITTDTHIEYGLTYGQGVAVAAKFNERGLLGPPQFSEFHLYVPNDHETHTFQVLFRETCAVGLPGYVVASWTLTPEQAFAL